MLNFLRVALIAPVLLMLGCAQGPPVPEDTSDTFVLERDLAGRTVAHGDFQAVDGTNEVIVLSMEGTVDGDELKLVQDYDYSDGIRQQKIWLFTNLGDGKWSGTRDDISGTAKGYQDGDVFRLEYKMKLAVQNAGTKLNMRFRHVLALDAQGNIINNATVGLFGFKVGTVQARIRRLWRDNDSDEES